MDLKSIAFQNKNKKKQPKPTIFSGSALQSAVI